MRQALVYHADEELVRLSVPFLRAGACAVGLGSALVEPQAVQRGDLGRISDLAAQYVAAMGRIRSQQN